MKQKNRYLSDMLDFDIEQNRSNVLWRACKPVAVNELDGKVWLTVPFEAQIILDGDRNNKADTGKERRLIKVWLQSYGSEILRVSLSPVGELPLDESVMLEWDPSVIDEYLHVIVTDAGWDVRDSSNMLRTRIVIKDAPIQYWSDLIGPPPEMFEVTLYPDGKVAIPFMAQDSFHPTINDSLSLAFVEKEGETTKVSFALHAEQHEKFAGTGERFAKMDLSGRTVTLENEDALGVNNRRAYKNIPFYLSSKPYGLFIHSSAHIRLSFADISTRTVQAAVEDGALDLFVIGGGQVERILYNYRCITGFPHHVPPLWSFGTWMSRMSYWTADETREVAHRMREGKFPCDVIHLDTGWFKEDWKCDWEFSADKYPDPAGYMQEMRENGFRISLWQNHSIGTDNKYYDFAVANKFIALKKPTVSNGSNFSSLQFAGTIDFSNPAATQWYQGLLEQLLKIGAVCIKTDFGEDIDMEANYFGLPAKLLHNRYSLLYQKAAYEITEQTTGEGIIWARSGWAGSQRYPIHWGGDCGCTWDGLAGTIRGGLHIGLSGFAFWSHDVPGFHGVPNFMNSFPENDLYVRWTQVGVFTSHLRYHGAQAREPYAYPEIAPLVRKWLILRYALIPYLLEQSKKAISSGLPIFRSMVFHHGKDPMCWNIDDQYYYGDHILVAPVLDISGIRNVYLPQGEWVDIWTGLTLQGPIMLYDVYSPLDKIPIFVVKNVEIAVYPESVQCTDEMDLSKTITLSFDETYTGISDSILGKLSGL